jgi:enoyl-CoA hydratase
VSDLVEFEELSGGIGVIRLNSPSTLNAMDETMAIAFRAKFLEIKEHESNYRALILTGAGKAFSAGGNLSMLKAKTELSYEENRRRMLWFYDSFLCILQFNIPLIAAVNGHAVGAGLCLASACDLRVISTEAKLGMTFTRLGLHPGMGATYFLPRVLGAAKAAEYMLTGRLIAGEEVAISGFASRLVGTDLVMPTALEIANEITACGPRSISALLSTLRGSSAELQSALEREAACQSNDYQGEEFLEGISAAIEKRAPNYTNGALRMR